jgi:hypothetical protein
MAGNRGGSIFRRALVSSAITVAAMPSCTSAPSAPASAASTRAEGQYELVADHRSGKMSADNLKAVG